MRTTTRLRASSVCRRGIDATGLNHFAAAEVIIPARCGPQRQFPRSTRNPIAPPVLGQLNLSVGRDQGAVNFRMEVVSAPAWVNAWKDSAHWSMQRNQAQAIVPEMSGRASLSSSPVGVGAPAFMHQHTEAKG